MSVSRKEKLFQILAEGQVNEELNESYEDARLYKDIGVARYFHKWIVKPIARYGSTRLLRKAILNAVGDVRGKTVIDVSCGDDVTILKIADKAKRVIANDISIHAMIPVIQASYQDNIQFTHSNFTEDLDVPQADIVICKNTLHHLNSVGQIEKALRKLKKLGKKIVIMDIENPKFSARARLWNAYYIFLLKDQGRFFISYDQFKSVLQVVYKNMDIRTKKIKTIKGYYMLAIVQ